MSDDAIIRVTNCVMLNNNQIEVLIPPALWKKSNVAEAVRTAIKATWGEQLEKDKK